MTHVHAPALLALPPSKTIDSFCSTCGTFQKTGKVSCCAPGGSWFQKCGAVGHSTFDHTWADGIRACNSVEAAAHSAVAQAQSVIRQQNTTQPSNAPRNATHSQDTIDSQPRNVTGPQEVVTRPQEVNQSQDVTQAQTSDCTTTGTESHVGATDSTARAKLAKLAVCASLSFIVLRLHI